MVDLVERDDGRKLLVGEGVDDFLNRFIAPVLKRLFEVQAVEGTGDDGGCGAVARKLGLQCFNGGGFDGDVSAFYRAPWMC